MAVNVCQLAGNTIGTRKFPSEALVPLDYGYGSTIFKDNPGLVLGCGLRFLQLLQFGDDWFLVRCFLPLNYPGDKLSKIKIPFICHLLHVPWHEFWHLMCNFRAT